jgi:hypothetical protein
MCIKFIPLISIAMLWNEPNLIRLLLTSTLTVSDDQVLSRRSLTRTGCLQPEPAVRVHISDTPNFP